MSHSQAATDIQALLNFRFVKEIVDKSTVLSKEEENLDFKESKYLAHFHSRIESAHREKGRKSNKIH